MAKHVRGLARIAAVGVAALFHGSAAASTFFGELPVGSSDSFFQVVGATSMLAVDISALGARDPTICPSCYSSYTDSYTVRLFDQAGTLLKSVNAVNYFYYNMFGSSNGIGAGPVSVGVPTGTTTLEIQSQLYIAGLLGPGGLPLSFGDLSVTSDGSIAAATPIPATLPLLATGLVGLGLLVWRVNRQESRARSPRSRAIECGVTSISRSRPSYDRFS